MAPLGSWTFESVREYGVDITRYGETLIGSAVVVAGGAITPCRATLIEPACRIFPLREIAFLR